MSRHPHPSQRGPRRPKKLRGPEPFPQERFNSRLGPYQQPHKKLDSGEKTHDGLSESQGETRPHQAEADETDRTVRLHKAMAQAGVASRRACEELITAGRVAVNGDVVTTLGTRIDPESDAIAVDGIRVQTKAKRVYYAFNKPLGVHSTMDDPQGRPSISDYLRHEHRPLRLFHVGRLDADSEGLLLLTNDGALAHRLAHPRYEVPKRYLVHTHGPMEKGIGKAMREGIALEDGISAVDSFKLVGSAPGQVLVEVVLHSGKNRIVRRLFDAVEHPVQRLVRLQVGPVRLGNEKPGALRPLSRHEVGHLLASVNL